MAGVRTKASSTSLETSKVMSKPMKTKSILSSLLLGIALALGLTSCAPDNQGPAVRTSATQTLQAPPNLQVTSVQPKAERPTPPVDPAPPAPSPGIEPATGRVPSGDQVDLALYRNAQRLVQVARSVASLTNTTPSTNRP